MSIELLMTRDHELWKEFITRLEGPEGCNFRKDEEGKIIWNCNGEMDKPLARAILETYSFIKTDETLKYFERYGAYCDCEILFNVPR